MHEMIAATLMMALFAAIAGGRTIGEESPRWWSQAAAIGGTAVSFAIPIGIATVARPDWLGVAALGAVMMLALLAAPVGELQGAQDKRAEDASRALWAKYRPSR